MVAQRVAKSAAQRWLGDAGTYPVIATCVIASGICTYQCVRYLSGHPDVQWNKKNRSDIFRYDNTEGQQWQSHRRFFATIHKNAVNESKGLN